MVSTNNSSNIKNEGVQYFDGAGTFSGIDGSTSGKVLTSNGIGVAPSFQAVTVPTFQVVTQVFTSSGTYTPTAGMVYCIVELVGGGGGGGGCGTASSTLISVGSGGAGGSYSRKTLSAASIGAGQSITIGAGGTAGTSVSPFTGGTGGTTTFGSIFNATGGNPGGGSSGSIQEILGGAAGDTGSTGADFSSAGGPGGQGIALFFATGNNFISGGMGGNSIFGGGGRSPFESPVPGEDATGYGGGGSGACNQNSSGKIGGAGFAGIAIVTEFII